MAEVVMKKKQVLFLNILTLLMATTLTVGCNKQEKSHALPDSKQQARSGDASQKSKKAKSRVGEEMFRGKVVAIKNKFFAEIILTKDGKEDVWENGGEFKTKDEAEKHVDSRIKQLVKELKITKGKFLSRFSRTQPEDFKQGFILEIVLEEAIQPSEFGECLGIFSSANDAVGIIDKRISNLMKERELFNGKFFTNIQFNRDDFFPPEKVGTFSASIIRYADNPHYGGRSIEFYAYWFGGLENLVYLL